MDRVRTKDGNFLNNYKNLILNPIYTSDFDIFTYIQCLEVEWIYPLPNPETRYTYYTAGPNSNLPRKQ